MDSGLAGAASPAAPLDGTPSAKEIIVTELVDGRKIGRYQMLVLALCALTVVLDGFDAQAIGFVAPAIKQEWGIAPAVLGPVFAAGLLGMVVGSLILSALADRVGRRPVMVGAVLFSGLGMWATGYVQSVDSLLAMRFITGLGLGAIMPNALALTSEFSPHRHRTFMVMMMACCFSLGAAIGGAVAAVLIPEFGWRSVFFIGGIAPVVMSIVMLCILPESLHVLAREGGNRQRFLDILKRIAPDQAIGPNTRIVMSETRHEGVPVGHLFRQGRTPATLLLWLMHFMNLADLYFLANWLPTIIRDSGMPIRTAVIAGAMLQGGSVVGAIVLGSLINRFGYFRVLPLNYLCGTLAIAAIGQVNGSAPVLFAMTFVAGFCAIGGLNGINALAVSSYPATLRTTGIGWALGIGRFGSILAPLLGGALIAMHWGASALFMVAAAPALVLAVALIVMKRVTRTV